MYIYDRKGVGVCWGHISSKDLVHWQHHPDSIGPGDYDKKNDKSIPDNHDRMTWVDNTYFAPEALIDDKGRQS